MIRGGERVCLILFVYIFFSWTFGWTWMVGLGKEVERYSRGRCRAVLD